MELFTREVEGGETEFSPELLPERTRGIGNGELAGIDDGFPAVLLFYRSAAVLKREDEEFLVITGDQTPAARH